MSLEALAAVVTTLLLFLAAWVSVAEQERWEKFKADRNCRVTSRATDTTSVGFDTSGNMSIIVTPGKTGWACDDGVTYYR